MARAIRGWCLPSAQRAFTLLELTLIMGILVSFVLVSLSSIEEGRDAQALQLVQASLQSVIIQGSQRSEVAPDALDPAKVILATPPNPRVTITAVGANGYTIAPVGQARSVSLTVNACGDLCATALTGFVSHVLADNGHPCEKPPAPAVVCQAITHQ
jgi:type II secretory pathway pseudopilin PulG